MILNLAAWGPLSLQPAHHCGRSEQDERTSTRSKAAYTLTGHRCDLSESVKCMQFWCTFAAAKTLIPSAVAAAGPDRRPLSGRQWGDVPQLRRQLRAARAAFSPPAGRHQPAADRQRQLHRLRWLRRPLSSRCDPRHSPCLPLIPKGQKRLTPWGYMPLRDRIKLIWRRLIWVTAG